MIVDGRCTCYFPLTQEAQKCYVPQPVAGLSPSGASGVRKRGFFRSGATTWRGGHRGECRDAARWVAHLAGCGGQIWWVGAWKESEDHDMPMFSR